MSHSALSRTIIQTCYHVADLKAACEHWNRMFGIGPFWTMQNPKICDVLGPSGEKIDLAFTAAIGVTGDYTIELIQSHDNAELFASIPHGGTQRVHHIAFFSEDYDADIADFAAQGERKICEIVYPSGKRIGYIDARKSIGHHIEILEENPDIRAIVDSIVAGSREWDGKELMRPVQFG